MYLEFEILFNQMTSMLDTHVSSCQFKVVLENRISYTYTNHTSILYHEFQSHFIFTVWLVKAMVCDYFYIFQENTAIIYTFNSHEHIPISLNIQIFIIYYYINNSPTWGMWASKIWDFLFVQKDKFILLANIY